MNYLIHTVWSYALEPVANVVVLRVVIASAINHASAAETCYDDLHFPLVSKLSETEHGIQVTLGGYYANERLRNFPVIYWNEETDWTTRSGRSMYIMRFVRFG